MQPLVLKGHVNRDLRGLVAEKRVIAIASVVAAILTRYLLDLSVVRTVGAAEFGFYSVVLAYAWTVSSLAGFGQTELANRELPKLRGNPDGRDASAFAWFGLSLGILIGWAVGSLGAIGLILAHGSSAYWVLAVLAPSLTSFIFIRQLALLDLNRQSTGLMLPALGSLIAVIGIQAVERSVGLATGSGAILIACVSYLLLALWQGKRHLDWPPTWRLANDKRSRWLRAGRIILSSNLATTLTTQLDLLLIAFFVGPLETGFYAAASRLSLLVSFALAGLIVRDGPRFGHLLSRGDFVQCWFEYRRSTILSTLIGMGVTVFLVVEGRFLLGLFGDEFSNAWSVLIIIAIGRFASAATGPVAELLIASGREDLSALGAWVGLILGLATVLALGPAMGSVGVALGASVGIASRNIVQRILLRQTTPARAARSEREKKPSFEPH